MVYHTYRVLVDQIVGAKKLLKKQFQILQIILGAINWLFF
jgi:hypothetical protein